MWNKCIKALKKGNWESGWPDHEWIRTGNPEFKNQFEPTPTYGKPIWRGETEPISLLVNADFGMGDTIHFYRFMSEITPKVKKVYLKCDNDFKNLFEVEVCQNPNFDKICHMMTLPKILKSKISGRPYLKPQGQPNEILNQIKTNLIKIGFCWCGNPFNPKDYQRSIPCDIFQNMITDRIMPFSLVKHYEPPDNFLDARGLMSDWNQTAHLLHHLDLIISVDTAVAHLGGALGIPTWLLLPEDSDWRWGESGSSTIWYDSIKIFRTNNWSNLIEPIRQELYNLS